MINIVYMIILFNTNIRTLIIIKMELLIIIIVLLCNYNHKYQTLFSQCSFYRLKQITLP